MERDELRALQAPLKDRYSEEPGAALVTLSAILAATPALSTTLTTA